MSGEKILLRVALFLVSSLFYTYTYGQGAFIPPEKPKLVIGIIVEQLRYDQIEKFRSRLSENGILKLLNEGTFFQNASYQYMLTQSAPGHATISTGAEPAYHGIISDSWYLPLKDELIYCTMDNSVKPVGGSFESGLHSPVNLKSSTFSDELEMSTGSQSKVFAVGIKENPVIFSAGHAADGAFWYDDITGTMMSSTYYTDTLPDWVTDFNSMRYSESYLTNPWLLLRPQSDYAGCIIDTNPFESGFGGLNYFPYDLNKISTMDRNGLNRNYSVIRETPFGNSYTTRFAKALIENEKLGQDDITDFISICYTSTDYIGHRFGPSSFEMADAIFRLDEEVEDLLKFLTESLGKKNILIYFTSAHGISEVPGILESNRIPSGYFRQDQALQLLRSYLNAAYGKGDWVKGYTEKQVFLNRTLVEDSKIPLEEIQKKVARFLVQFTGVASAYPYSAFETNDFGNGSLKKIINNFSQQRSGDVFVTLNPGWVEKQKDQVTNHNSPYEYDSHVPLIWYGWSVDRAAVTRQVNMTDISATLSSICKVPYPNACTGEPMHELFR